MTPELIGLVAVAVVVLAFFAAALRIVPQGHEYVVERFGSYRATLGAGLKFLVPLVDRVAHRQNIAEQVLGVDRIEVGSREGIRLGVEVSCLYQVVNSAQASYEVANLSRSLADLATTEIRNRLSGMTLEDIMGARGTLGASLLAAIDPATEPWGVKVTRLEIGDVAMPEDLAEALATEMRVASEQRARIAEAEGLAQEKVLAAEAAKQAALLEAESEAETRTVAAAAEQKAALAAAEAERDVARLTAEAVEREAEAHANARETAAEAEARATLMLAQALEQGDERAARFSLAQRYVDTLGQIAGAEGSRIVVLPMEMTNIAQMAEGFGGMFGARSGAQPADPVAAKPDVSAAASAEPVEDDNPASEEDQGAAAVFGIDRSRV